MHNPEKFYGGHINYLKQQHQSRCLLQLKKNYHIQKEKPFPAVFKSRLDGPSVAWNVFKRLSLAVSFADSCTKDCMVFSFEERLPENPGQRLFLVTHPQHLWLNHKSRPVYERCSYEVIRENFPCKLYFDLEFNRDSNPSKDGNALTKIFIQCIIAAFLEEHNISCDASDILWLDASTDKKFSVHLILPRKDIGFENNIQAGVYSKNRNFRMYLSTKYGKRAPLVLSAHNQYRPSVKVKLKDIDEIIFYDSLVTYYRDGRSTKNFINYKTKYSPIIQLQNGLSVKKNNNACGSSGCSSPFPEVDNFVLTLIRDNFMVGFIRKWTFISKEQLLIYDIGNYRFCWNIERHHKSNNIMIIVDIQKNLYYQKCHDPECRAQNFKSKAKMLPEFVSATLSIPDDFFETDCFTQLSNLNEAYTLSENSNWSLDDMHTEGDANSGIRITDDDLICSFSDCSQFSEMKVSGSPIKKDFRAVNDEGLLNDASNSISNEFWDSKISDDWHEKKSTEISFEEELMMAEAAAVVEATIDTDSLSEETVF
ncbi:DNA-directed primase/polymerase protein-like isoform X2 [Stegodyphus dumicola]|uniref:DNA-directed primase/polymerase protein-like isoform X2 n=1 Tax=Stegodyphus dumicola TaxID=202533 RepID=UPI0015A8A96C|nr:DNA-directed primase/polymerase protein-like isoform X2 [Stegodyphus dumicola]